RSEDIASSAGRGSDRVTRRTTAPTALPAATAKSPRPPIVARNRRRAGASGTRARIANRQAPSTRSPASAPAIRLPVATSTKATSPPVTASSTSTRREPMGGRIIPDGFGLVGRGVRLRALAGQVEERQRHDGRRHLAALALDAPLDRDPGPRLGQPGRQGAEPHELLDRRAPGHARGPGEPAAA